MKMDLPKEIEDSVEDLAKNVAKHKMAANIEIMEPVKKKKKADKEDSDDYSLEDGVAMLIEDWDPKTPEGKKYLKDLQGLQGDHGSHGEEDY